MEQTTRIELKAPENAPQVLSSGTEPFNVTGSVSTNSVSENSKFYSLWESGYNSEQSEASMSGRVFVLSKDGEPLTPCKPRKARKMMEGGVAKPVGNKFGQFGVQMLVDTRKHKPKTILGIDFGTKFEGYSLVSGRKNLLNVMWLLPDKKKLVKKLEKRRILRRARRFKKRRRKARFNNRSRKNFIAPSQLQIVQSRLKAIKEFLKYFPISKIALEDVRFNHRDYAYGKNFSTIEIGKQMINNFISKSIGRENLIKFDGHETQRARKKFGLRKVNNKSSENIYSHCIDSLAMISEITGSIKPNENLIVVDDTYRPTRRRLHDTQPAKGGIRKDYSRGNFKGIRKGKICELGQIVGGTKNVYYIRDLNNKRIGRTNVNWYSKQFKTKALLPEARPQGIGAYLK